MTAILRLLIVSRFGPPPPGGRAPRRIAISLASPTDTRVRAHDLPAGDGPVSSSRCLRATASKQIITASKRRKPLLSDSEKRPPISPYRSPASGGGRRWHRYPP